MLDSGICKHGASENDCMACVKQKLAEVCRWVKNELEEGQEKEAAAAMLALLDRLIELREARYFKRAETQK